MTPGEQRHEDKISLGCENKNKNEDVDSALVLYIDESPDLLVLSDEVILTSEANGFPHSFRKQMKLKTCK